MENRKKIATKQQQKHKQEFSIKDYMFTRPEYVQVTNSFLCCFVFSLHPHFVLCVLTTIKAIVWQIDIRKERKKEIFNRKQNKVKI